MLPGYFLRYDWSDLYGNQPGTLQLVKANGPTGEEVSVVSSCRLEEGDGSELGGLRPRVLRCRAGLQEGVSFGLAHDCTSPLRWEFATLSA